MSIDLANAVAKCIREKINDVDITHSLKIMAEGSFLFERLPMYKPYPNHCFDIMIRGRNIRSLMRDPSKNVPPPSVYLYHSTIGDGIEDYDDIEFFSFEDEEICFEYHMSERAINNVIHRTNYPDEWEMFSDKMPWNWIREQFKLIAIKSL